MSNKKSKINMKRDILFSAMSGIIYYTDEPKTVCVMMASGNDKLRESFYDKDISRQYL